MKNGKMPRLALDMYVLAQGVKTGVYRVCDELFPRLAKATAFDTRLLIRPGYEKPTGTYLAGAGWNAQRLHAVTPPDSGAEILLSPFGVAPNRWRDSSHVLRAHIVYDLIAIDHPDYFSVEGAKEVGEIMASLDERTVIFAISEHTRRELLAYRPDLSPGQVKVIPLAAGDWFRPCESLAERQAMRTAYRIPADAPYVLSLATLEIRKNLDQVVRSFVRYLDANPSSPMHLVLAGMTGWKLEKLEQSLVDAGRWRDRIVLPGFVEDRDLSALYSEATCFVYLSRCEGFGLPPLEAMACGTPVICGDNTSLPEVVGDAGILLDVDDTEGAARAIERLAHNEDQRAELSRKGLLRAASFSWDRAAEIVAETLAESWRRSIVPTARAQHAPQLLVEIRQGADLPPAGLNGYANGSVGPILRVRKEASTSAWPIWSDRLPPSTNAERSEGGLRMQGRLKSGTVERPLVSYVTVVRNNTATLARTIESVQGQKYGNVEHIVLDGASSDGTMALIQRYGDRLDYFASEPDRNLYDAINKGVGLARGQLICILNSDDWLEPEAAEIAVRRMGTHLDSAALLLSAALVRSNDSVFQWHPSFVHPGCYFTCANDCHNAIYATRAAYEFSGRYDISFRIAADFKWIMTCAESGVRMVYTREPTVNYSMGGTSGDVRSHSLECMRVFGERFEELGPVEVSGLYHSFFRLAGPVAELEPDKPASITRFLRDTFEAYHDRPDFLEALSWACMATMVHPDDAPVGASVRPASVKIVRSVKEIAKTLLHKHPGLYGAAARGYRRFRR